MGKVLIAPAADMVAGIVTAASVWLSATETESRLASVADTAPPTATASAQLLDAVDKTQTKAMCAVVWQQAGVPQATIDGPAKAVVAGLAALRKTAAGMAATPPAQPALSHNFDIQGGYFTSLDAVVRWSTLG